MFVDTSVTFILKKRNILSNFIVSQNTFFNLLQIITNVLNRTYISVSAFHEYATESLNVYVL